MLRKKLRIISCVLLSLGAIAWLTVLRRKTIYETDELYEDLPEWKDNLKLRLAGRQPLSPVETVKTYLSGYEFVFVTFIDESYFDMAMNFYETSIASHNIENILFVSQSREVCIGLMIQGIVCSVFDETTTKLEHSNYGGKIFRRKMDTRAELMLELLNNDINIFITDVDIIFISNPVAEISEECKGFDICFLRETANLLNAGFILLRSTPVTRSIMKRRIRLTLSQSPPTDQDALNRAVREHKQAQVKDLDRKKFVQGKSYFQVPKRYFADTASKCTDCMVVHNNWIVSKTTKVYRFRENLMWNYDGEEYYSCSDCKYLTYNNPVVKDRKKQVTLENNSLRNALAIGMILNRSVILPKFHCSNGNNNELCPLNSHINMQAFDSVFHLKWREHMFLAHHKVPKSIKTSNSTQYIINKSLENILTLSKNEKIKYLDPSQDVITEEDILSWFGEETTPLLSFHSLYNAFDTFTSNTTNTQFDADVKKGFKPDSYKNFKS